MQCHPESDSSMLGYSPAMHKRASFLLAALACGTSLLPVIAHAQAASPPPRSANPPILLATPSTAVREAFEAAARGTFDDALLESYSRHPLGGWLEFTALRKRMDTLPVPRGNAFLARHRGEPVARAFRSDWLTALAARSEWQALLANWESGIDDPGLRCLRLQALQATGRVDAAWTAEAQALWRGAGKSLPASCDAPFAQLATQGALDDGLRWERFDKAVAEGQSGVMRAIARGMAADAATQATAYAAYIDKATADVSAWPKNARSRLVASWGLARVAKAAPDQAEALLPGVAQAKPLRGPFGKPCMRSVRRTASPLSRQSYSVLKLSTRATYSRVSL